MKSISLKDLLASGYGINGKAFGGEGRQVIDRKEQFEITAVESDLSGNTFRLNIVQDPDAETVSLDRFIPVTEAVSVLLQWGRLGAYPDAVPGLHLGTKTNSPDQVAGWIESTHDAEITVKDVTMTVARMPKNGWAPLYIHGRTATAGPEIAYSDAVGKVIYPKNGRYPEGSHTGDGFILERDARTMWYHVVLDELVQGHNLSLHVATKDNGGGSWPYAKKLLVAWEAETVEEARRISNENASNARQASQAFDRQRRIRDGQRVVDVGSFVEPAESPHAGKILLPLKGGGSVDPDTILSGQHLEVWNAHSGIRRYTCIWPSLASAQDSFVLDVLDKGQVIVLL
jgi:hypothetical protein